MFSVQLPQLMFFLVSNALRKSSVPFVQPRSDWKVCLTPCPCRQSRMSCFFCLISSLWCRQDATIYNFLSLHPLNKGPCRGAGLAAMLAGASLSFGCAEHRGEEEDGGCHISWVEAEVVLFGLGGIWWAVLGVSEM